MREIKNMSKQIHEEMHGAKEYAIQATAYKEAGNQAAGKVYFELANDEIKHAMSIHGLVVKLIEETRKTVTPPQYMLDMWNEEHEEYMEEMAKVKYMLAEYAK